MIVCVSPSHDPISSVLRPSRSTPEKRRTRPSNILPLSMDVSVSPNDEFISSALHPFHPIPEKKTLVRQRLSFLGFLYATVCFLLLTGIIFLYVPRLPFRRPIQLLSAPVLPARPLSPLPRRLPPPTVRVETLLLRITWMPTQCSINHCSNDYPDRFSPHGLWPISKLGLVLTGNGQRPIRDFAGFPFENDLKQWWPCFFSNKNHHALWRHEYNIHGVEGYSDHLEYLRVALILMRRVQRLNLNILDRSISYTFVNIGDIIRTAINQPGQSFRVQVKCTPYNVTHDRLYEISLCFDSHTSYDYPYQSCPIFVQEREGCGKKNFVPNKHW
ncbi:hypothetical protein OROGR_006117 [Orobanche gracilis]